MSKTLVVFYSRGGKTRTGLTELSKYLDGDVEELIDLKNRKGLLGFIFSGRDAIKKVKAEMKPIKYKVEDYDRIIIGTPVWASTMSCAVRTYIEGNKGKFKNVAFIATSGGPVDGKIFEEMSELCGVKPITTCNIVRKEFNGDIWKEKLTKFVEQLK